MDKDQQNLERRLENLERNLERGLENLERNLERGLAKNQEENISEPPECGRPSVIEVDVEVSVQENNHVTGSDVKTQSDGLKFNSKCKPVSPRRKRQFSPLNSDCVCKPGDPKSVLVSCPSEASIISAAALEELSDLRSYYNKQLRRINYISHERLQDSSSGMLTCIREPLRSLRLPSSTTIAKSARNLWTRVSMRRKLIQR